MVEVLISEGALVIALLALLVAHLRSKKIEDDSIKREMEYRAQIAKDTKATLAEALKLKNAEEERLKERLQGLLKLSPDIERLVKQARETVAAEKWSRGETQVPSELTGGHNRYARGEIA